MGTGVGRNPVGSAALRLLRSGEQHVFVLHFTILKQYCDWRVCFSSHSPVRGVLIVVPLKSMKIICSKMK